MNGELRVLIVDDVATDARLVARELGRSGRRVYFERVEDADAMRAALERGTWEVVICDWSMPMFSAMGAIALLRDVGVEIPLIIVSGTVGEETAVEGMRAGAQDYVLKHQLTRLVPAVERELKEFSARRAHRASEDARRASEERYRQIVETTSEGVVIVDAHGTITFGNTRLAAMLGAPVDSLPGRSIFDFIDEASCAPGKDGEAHARPEIARQSEATLRRVDGATRWVLLESTPIREAGEGDGGALIMMMDVTQRRLDEDARRESEAAQRLLFEASPLPVFLIDLETLGLVVVNDAAVRLYGYSRAEFLTLRIGDLHAPGNDEQVAETVRALVDDWRGAVTHRRRDGTWVQVEVTARSLTLRGRRVRLAVVVDVTEKLALEAQLRQSQKMDAVGRLAGGIAHDFNNLLSVILSYGSLLLGDLPADSPLRADVEEICAAGERAAELTRQLLMFSRQQVLEPKVLDLNEVLTHMDRMLRRILGEDVEMVLRLQEPIGRVRADRGSIEQVVMNLVVNARDAMPQGGRLTVETDEVTLDEAYARTHLGVQPGPHVMIAVSDSGVGMDKATQARIFEPFFTTKERGKGTGLGLSTVFGVVRQSNGSVWVYSEPGGGTSFKIYLPRVDAGADPAADDSGADDLGGTETILLVEDEEPIRVVSRGILQRRGYTVLDARDGAEAESISRAHAGVIHLLLTDVVMPQMSGSELARKLALTRPRMRVLFMSGYTDDSIVHHGVLSQSMAFLQKPLTPASLTRKVRRVLDAVGATGRGRGAPPNRG